MAIDVYQWEVKQVMIHSKDMDELLEQAWEPFGVYIDDETVWIVLRRPIAEMGISTR